jgi:hypothetical protein
MGQLWALHGSQLRAQMNMSLKQYHKCQSTNNVPTIWAKYERQQWAEVGLSLRHYHKGRIQLMGQQRAKTMWTTSVSFMSFFFFFFFASFDFLFFFDFIFFTPCILPTQP